MAPLRKIGMTLEGRGDGADFFQEDDDGYPIYFVGCRMTMTIDEWRASEWRGEEA